MDLPDTLKVARRTIELLGGQEKAAEIMMRDFEAMKRRWNQNTDTIGRILRAHLYVEHYLTEYLQNSNPNLGSTEKARLSYSQKVSLLSPNDPQLTDIIEGIKHLNSIRNRLAHNLDVSITAEDAKVFLAAKIFAALRTEGAKPGSPSIEPMQVLENFAQHAGQALGTQFSAFAKAFAVALKESAHETGT
jgi:hypothetical protein